MTTQARTVLAGLAREQRLGEEIANVLSHGLGLVAAIVGTVVLIVRAAQRGDAAFVVAVSLFGATMIFLYLASTLYHALPMGRAKLRLRVVDHAAIFLLIAGTYTPFTLGVLRGAWGWSLFGVVWGLAVIGVALKLFDKASNPIFSTGLYLLMGWVIVVAVNPMFDRVATAGLLWLLGGGLCYTLGVVFFAIDDRLHYGHFIWHLFVLAGTTCHYFAVLWYAA